MNGPPQKPPTKPVPMTEWLTLMLGEIEQKESGAKSAAEERKRRDDAQSADEGNDSADK